MINKDKFARLRKKSTSKKAWILKK